jgi:hypothetical protein
MWLLRQMKERMKERQNKVGYKKTLWEWLQVQGGGGK